MNLISKMLFLRRLLGASSSARGRKAGPQPARFRPGVLTLEDRTVPAPVNDMFADARLLTGTFAWDTGTNVEATAEVSAGEPVGVLDPITLQSGNSDPLNTVWWRWTAPVSGTVEINTFDSTFDTQLAVYTGPALNNLTVVRAHDDVLSPTGDNLSLQSRVVFDAVAGTTYHIAVDGFSDATGDVVLRLGMTPPNDSFAAATVITTETTLAGSSILATAEPGEPTGSGTSGTVNTVWWSWTAAESRTVEVNTFGSGFDTLLAVYTGSAVDALTLVAANDDAVRDVVRQSQLTFDAVAGTTYHFAVDGFLEETGVITLNMPAPAGGNTAPTIAPQTFTINENRVGGAVVGTVVAGDPDGDALAYAITAGNESGAFTINSGGVIQVLDGRLINFETNPTFTLTVEVTDDGSPPLSNSATVTISLTDLNEAPVVAAQAFAIDENSAAGTVVGVVAASDEDVGQTLTYAITAGNQSGAFALDPATGRITVADAALLDFEATPSFALTVEVTDSGSPALSTPAAVTVNVNDLDETQPLRAPVVEDQALSVDEGSAIGAVVGTVVATDPDSGQVLTFAILAGNESGAFAIDARTGEVTVANPSLLNFETNPTFTLTVEVTDNGIPGLSDTATVTVNVANVNEAPVLDTRGSLSLAPINKGDVNNPGTLVSDLLLSSNRPRITDGDAGAVQGIAVIATDTRHGTWEFSTDGGATWQALGAVSDGSARLLASDALTRIRFVPGADFHGTLRRAITFRAWDQTSGTNGGLGDATVNGGSSAFSVATEIASLRVRSTTEQILLLSVEVHDLRRADVLTSGQAYDLQSKLVAAVKKSVCGDTFGATCHLEEFIARVREFAAAGVLTQDVCDDLCASAEAIIDSLS